jgi:hypothetical protein
MSENITINIPDHQALAILFFLSYHADTIKDGPYFHLLEEAIATLQHAVSSSVTPASFEDWHIISEIYSSIKLPA